MIISGVHDGYQKAGRGCLHRRTWSMEQRGLEIEDVVVGSGFHDVGILFHIHPDIAVEHEGATRFTLTSALSDLALGTFTVTLELDSCLMVSLDRSPYYPEFGSSLSMTRITGRWSGTTPRSFRARIGWPSLDSTRERRLDTCRAYDE